MSETIKTFTEITVEEAGEMLRDNGWKPVEGLTVNTGGAWHKTEWLDGLDLIEGNTHPFIAHYDAWAKCAKVTELDPCKAPDGCPELEPWMAYVGKGDSSLMKKGGFKANYSGHSNGGWSDFNCAGSSAFLHYAIDVRTAWAQEHYPEHCRIRNYQEPDPMEEAIDEFHRSFHTERDDSAFRSGWKAAVKHLENPTK